METSDKKHWVRRAILTGTLYLIFGVVFAVFAKLATSKEMGLVWRWAAWLASAVVFALHIWYEKFRMGNSPKSTALYASVASAFGAFTLALAANVNELLTASGYRYTLAIAIVIWPIITFVPAFFITWVVAALLAKIKQKN